MQQPEAAGAKVQQRFDNLNYNDIKKGKQLKFLRVSCDKLERFRSFVRSRGTETSLFSKNANLQLTRGESCGIIIDVAGNARRATMESAAVAHLVERHLAKVEVASSSLVGRSILWKFSSAGRASALQAEGQRFEPVNFHHCGPVAQLVRAPACHAGGRRFEPDPGRCHFCTSRNGSMPL